jgi:hypothetical protein
MRGIIGSHFAPESDSMILRPYVVENLLRLFGQVTVSGCKTAPFARLLQRMEADMEHLLEYATWSTRAQMDVALDGMTSLDDLPPVCAADGRRSICSFPPIQPVPCSWRPPRSQIMLYNQAYLPNCTFAHRLTHPVHVCKLRFWHLASRACHMTQLNQL